MHATAAASLQSCPTLCDAVDGSPLGSLIPGILQAGTLEWVAMPSPMHESEEFPFPTPSLTFVNSSFFDDSHSNRCEVVSHCDFDLYFPDN